MFHEQTKIEEYNENANSLFDLYNEMKLRGLEDVPGFIIDQHNFNNL